jgi:YVTN family beta-propeller protein
MERAGRGPRGHGARPLLSFGTALVLALILFTSCDTSASSRPTPTATALPAIPSPAVLAAYHVYVTDLVSGNVALLGRWTLHVSESIHGLGLSADGKTLYVTNISGSRLDALPIGADPPIIAHSTLVGAQPVHVVGSLDGRTLFVTDYGEQSVSVVDTSTWTLKKSIAVPARPHGIVLSPDGRYAYVACSASAAVAVLDVAQETLAATIPLGQPAEPYGIAISADGRYLYVSDNFSRALDVLDTTTRRLVTSVPVGLRPALVARAPSGATLYVANGQGASISVLDLAHDPAHPRVRATIPVGGYPHGIAVTPDGRYIVVANTISRNLSVIDTATDAVVAIIQDAALQYPNDVLITR